MRKRIHNPKILGRVRRSRKLRGESRRLQKVRLCVHRSHQHIYVQLISPDNRVLAAASTLENDVKATLKSTGNKEAAQAVGKLIAARAKEAGVTNVVFDRAGYRYHGRVKALADGAREGGME